MKNEITTFSSSNILTNPPPPTTHMRSYTTICAIFLSYSVVLNYVLHDSTNCLYKISVYIYNSSIT